MGQDIRNQDQLRHVDAQYTLPYADTSFDVRDDVAITHVARNALCRHTFTGWVSTFFSLLPRSDWHIIIPMLYHRCPEWYLLTIYHDVCTHSLCQVWHLCDHQMKLAGT